MGDLKKLDHQEPTILKLKSKSKLPISVFFSQNMHYFSLLKEIYDTSDDQGEKNIMYYLIEAKEIVKEWNSQTNSPIVIHNSSITSFKNRKTK